MTTPDLHWPLVKGTEFVCVVDHEEWPCASVAVLAAQPEPVPICIGCGTTADLAFAEDPFESEINDDSTEVWECGACRNESAMDI